jgi:hypothetical protein
VKLSAIALMLPVMVGSPAGVSSVGSAGRRGAGLGPGGAGFLGLAAGEQAQRRHQRGDQIGGDVEHGRAHSRHALRRQAQAQIDRRHPLVFFGQIGGALEDFAGLLLGQVVDAVLEEVEVVGALAARGRSHLLHAQRPRRVELGQHVVGGDGVLVDGGQPLGEQVWPTMPSCTSRLIGRALKAM